MVEERGAVERAVVAREIIVVVIVVTMIILIIIVLLILLMQQINISMRVLLIRLCRKLLEVVLWQWLAFDGGCRDLVEVGIEDVATLAKRNGTIRRHGCSLAGRSRWDSAKREIQLDDARNACWINLHGTNFLSWLISALRLILAHANKGLHTTSVRYSLIGFRHGGDGGELLYHFVVTECTLNANGCFARPHSPVFSLEQLDLFVEQILR